MAIKSSTMPKHKTDNRTAELKVDDHLDIQTDIIMYGIKLKFPPAKKYGTNQLVQALDEQQLEYISKLAENLKMPVWKYNEQCHLKVFYKRVIDYAVGKSKTEGVMEVMNFTKGMPYILELTAYRHEFEKIKNKLKDIQF